MADHFYQGVTHKEIYVSLPSKAAIIGKGGKKISDIRIVSGAAVTICQYEERAKVTIIGLPQAINLAEKLIINACTHCEYSRVQPSHEPPTVYSPNHAKVDLATIFSGIVQARVPHADYKYSL